MAQRVVGTVFLSKAHKNSYWAKVGINHSSSNKISEFPLHTRHSTKTNNQATMRITLMFFLATVGLVDSMGLKATSEQGKSILAKARKLGYDVSTNYQQYSQAYNSAPYQNNYYGQYNGQYNGQQDAGNYQQNWDGDSNDNDNAYQASQARNWGNGDNTNFDTTWLTGYSIKFDGCARDYGSSAQYDDGRVSQILVLCVR
jgi:hypothetical protein